MKLASGKTVDSWHQVPSADPWRQTGGRAGKLLLAIAAASALLLAACGGGEESAEAPTVQRAAMAVQTATAKVETTAKVLETSGSLEPRRRISPAAKLLGRVERLNVREGEPVRRGEVLVEIEKADLVAALAQAEAAVTMAQAELDNATAQNRRIEALHARGSVTDKNLEDTIARFRAAQAGLEQAEANRAAAKVAVGYATLKSPIDGWVAARHIETGDMARPGMPLLTLEDLSRLEVRTQVPEADVRSLAEGDPAVVEVLGQRLPTTIERIAPAGDPTSRTFEVKLLLDNPEGKLKSGLFARVTFPIGERRALRLPSSAIVPRGQLDGVFVVDNGRARLRWIEIDRGAAGTGEVEVLSGLSDGEQYVVAPPAGLLDGDPVTTAGNAGEGSARHSASGPDTEVAS